MKTPKREYKKYYICPATGEPVEWTLGNIDARRHRKNRIRQLKHTIARQAEEIDHLRAALAIRTIHDINENNIESLKFIQQHFTVDTFEPSIEREGEGNWMFKWKRPIPRWNNSIIDLHLPEDEQP